MLRTTFLQGGAALLAAAGVPVLASAASDQDPFSPRPGTWRTFVLTTRVTLGADTAPARAWVPVPAFAAADWIAPAQSTWATNALRAELHDDPHWPVRMLLLEWNAGSAPRTATIVSRVRTRDRYVDVSALASAPPLSTADRALYMSATSFIPTDGIVKATSDKITAGATSDIDKARRIYEWVVANTFRKASVRGCGLGNIEAMLVTGDYGGKCADINGLFVGLARAAGLPARDLFGIRVAPSRFGYTSLGANSPTITKAQHCRAEVFLDSLGWVPADPADVRKVALEEPPGNLALDDAKVANARATLFGAWETNWVAYNDGHDVALPDSTATPVPFLMYPQAEVAGTRLDPLAPADFAYEIVAQEEKAGGL